MAFWYYVFGTLLVVLGVTFGRDLYVVSHGNADNRRPGIYGGEMEENGTSPDLFSSGYHCAWFAEGSVSFNPLTIRAVSYDRKSNEALLTIIENMENKVSLMKAPICLDIPSCGNISQHLQPVFMHTRIAGGKMGPFALYDGVIYFVFVSEERMDDNTEITFEIRKVTCDNFPYSSIEAFVLSECTETVAVLHQVTINERAEKLETTNNLLVVKGPRFFTQLRHYTMQGMFAKTNKMELYTVKKGGTAVKLHEETVPINFVNLDFQGDVDYRDGLLCWTTTTKLLCGKWKRDSLNDITVVLSEGQASQVCRDITNEALTSNVTTGVAIQSARPISVYFGCMRDEDKGISFNWQPGGGAGFAKVKDGTVEIYPVKSNGTQVYATSMFLTDACANRHHGSSTSSILSPSTALVYIIGVLYLIYEFRNGAHLHHE